MKKILLLVLLLTVCKLSQSQTVTIGTGTTNSLYGPIYIYSNSSPNTHSWNLAIYDQSEIVANGGIAGPISGVSWYKNSTGAYLANDGIFEIFIKHTTLTVFATAADFNTEVTAATQVFFGTGQGLPATIGWVSYSFSGSFNWNGTDNIMVLTRWVRTVNGTDPVEWGSTTTTGIKLSHSFNSSSTMGSLYTTSNRPNIQLNMNTVSTNDITGTNKNDIHVYPNPFINQINFSLSPAQTLSKLIMRNVTGTIVKEEFSPAPSSGNYSFDPGYLPPGVYFLEIVTDEKTYFKKIVRSPFGE